MNSYKTLLSTLFLIVYSFCSSQQIRAKDLHDGVLSKENHQKFKDYLLSKNLMVKDTIFIKYDFNYETCWDQLDSENDRYINNVISGFQEHISKFNKAFPNAVAYNFREPGNKFNSLKKWDKTILIDDYYFLKNMFFSKKVRCGTSLVILGDGSYLLYEQDPHFSLLSLHHNYDGRKF